MPQSQKQETVELTCPEVLELTIIEICLVIGAVPCSLAWNKKVRLSDVPFA